MSDQTSFDYVVVGAGSAGCVVANRLSADPDNKVLLIEAGSDDRLFKSLKKIFSNFMITIPVGFAKTLNDANVNWLYVTEEDPTTAGRRHVWPRGKTVGGSSALNALLYIRGHRQDYDDWRDVNGCIGWGWDDVLPFYKKSEDQERGASDMHGVGGPQTVSDVTEQNPISREIIRAFDQAGVSEIDDINVPEPEGATWFQLNVKNGKRCQSSVAFIRPILKRPNFTLTTDALVQRVIFEGKRAVGVEYIKDGVKHSAMVNKEVILCGGAVNSPQLLEVSGIGQRELLEKHGIEVLVDSPRVGENLQDHLMYGMQWRTRPGTPSINSISHFPRVIWQVLKYLLLRKGLLTFSVAHVTALCKSSPEQTRPDIQFQMLPGTMDIDKINETQTMALETKPGITFSGCQVRPESRGSIHIKSADPNIHPEIRPNYLSHPKDLEVSVALLRVGREAASQPALARHIEHEIYPGKDLQTDEQLKEFCTFAGSPLYHPVGTCSMGGDPDSVLDPQLRVRGTEGLRVADASVIPRIISGNTNAVCVMIGEKAADLILNTAAAIGPQ